VVKSKRGQVPLNMQIDVDDVNDPTLGPNGNDLVLTLYPYNCDFNSETNDYVCGVAEDEDSNALSPAPTQQIISVD